MHVCGESIAWSSDSLKPLNGKIFSYLILTKSRAFQKKWITLHMSPANITSIRVLHSPLEEQQFQEPHHSSIKHDLGFVFKSMEVLLWFH